MWGGGVIPATRECKGGSGGEFELQLAEGMGSHQGRDLFCCQFYQHYSECHSENGSGDAKVKARRPIERLL